MSIYRKIAAIGPKFASKATLFKHGFNWSPMYRRSTGRIIHVTDDLLKVQMKIPISYKNKNYVGSIFGGSMFSAVDPIPMVQLINLLDSDYVVWDKSAEVTFKAPAKADLYASFDYSAQELEEIKQSVSDNNEIELIKTTQLTDKEQKTVFCEVKKTLYIASKEHYRNKRKARMAKNAR